MREIAKVVNIITSGHRVITYGYSMGGYAAIKYSKLLNADLGLTFSPQWSMNPEDIHDNRWAFDYDPILKGGEAIVESDIQGEHYVFVDPRENYDKDHVEVLVKYPGVHRVVLPFAWHGSLPHFTHNGGLKRLLSAAMHADTSNLAKFRGITRLVRNNNPQYHNVKIKTLRDRLIGCNKHKLYHELKRVTRYLTSQEDMLLHAVCVFLDGDLIKAQEIVNNPAEQGFNSVQTVDIEIILHLYRKYNFDQGVQVLEKVLINRQ